VSADVPPPKDSTDHAARADPADAGDLLSADRRRPRVVYSRGNEPDPRFSMANERTALAWVRTALAFVAGGIGLTSVVRLADLSRVLDVVAVVLCVLGALLAVAAVLGWQRRELAMRLDRPLPAPIALPWLGAAVAVVSLFMAGFLVVAVR
jgi:putative membrane protein